MPVDQYIADLRAANPAPDSPTALEACERAVEAMHLVHSLKNFKVLKESTPELRSPIRLGRKPSDVRQFAGTQDAVFFYVGPAMQTRDRAGALVFRADVEEGGVATPRDSGGLCSLRAQRESLCALCGPGLCAEEHRMTTATLPITELEVIGYVGRFQPEDWPLRLLPVYRSQSRQVYLLPPLQESGGTLQGEQMPAGEFDELEEEEEFTRLPEPMPARSNHLLWMGEEEKFHYMPREQAESALEEVCYQTVNKALEAGLSKRVTRELLFRSLRAKPTAVAYALLSLHFQRKGDFDQTRPIREDLAGMTRSQPTDLEQRLGELLTSSAKDFSREDATIIASELNRAQREALAQGLLDAAHVRSLSHVV